MATVMVMIMAVTVLMVIMTNIDIDDSVDIDDHTLAFLIAFCWAALSAPSSLPPTTMSIMHPFNTCWRESELLQNKRFLRNVK